MQCKIRRIHCDNLLPHLLQLNHMAILKLDRHDEDKEIEFELDYLTSLTTKQRFEIMFTKTREMLRLLKKDKRRKTTEVIKKNHVKYIPVREQHIHKSNKVVSIPIYCQFQALLKRNFRFVAD